MKAQRRKPSIGIPSATGASRIDTPRAAESRVVVVVFCVFHQRNIIRVWPRSRRACGCASPGLPVYCVALRSHMARAAVLRMASRTRLIHLAGNLQTAFAQQSAGRGREFGAGRLLDATVPESSSVLCLEERRSSRPGQRGQSLATQAFRWLPLLSFLSVSWAGLFSQQAQPLSCLSSLPCFGESGDERRSFPGASPGQGSKGARSGQWKGRLGPASPVRHCSTG